MKLSTYLNFGGDCRQAFAFYEQLLGAKVTAMMSFKDGPMADQMPQDQLDRVMHAELDIGGYLLMGTDGTEPNSAQDRIKGAHVVLDVDSVEDAERIFAALSEGGHREMAMDETFFAERFGMAVDCFGVPWMVIYAKPE